MVYLPHPCNFLIALCQWYAAYVMLIFHLFSLEAVYKLLVQTAHSVVLNLQFLTAELNLFYLKFILWIPPPHFIMQVRMALYLGIGAVSLNETFRYMDDP